ncbi:NfeD family protein [Candidatus Poriferisodalis sp.]|uniref:NfeD family protein n=1 Tax=Candidatus Poriferisodalis sp. TaxID=3101277 RepID=UPI003B02D1F6
MDNELWRWVWVAVAMVMGIGEIFTAGFFLLPFALGAALAAAAAWLDLHGAVQWLLFFGGTAVSMLILRRFMGRQDRPDDLPVGANRYVGMDGRVIEDIDLVENTGRVRVESDEWRAVADSGPIEEGSLVRVTALRGTKLLVELAEPPPPDYVRHSDPVAAPAAETSLEDTAEAATSESGSDSGDQNEHSDTPRSD